jgi:hypothetical protein
VGSAKETSAEQIRISTMVIGIMPKHPQAAKLEKAGNLFKIVECGKREHY